MNPRPCSAVTAVARAKELLVAPTNATTGYVYGTGGFLPGAPDLPWTTSDAGLVGSDCAGFAISWCYELPRHRPGFNAGPWATIADDINVDSAIEDSEHMRDLFVAADGAPQIGDLLVYPTIPKIGSAGPWIGHVAIVIGNARLCVAWDPSAPRYDLLDVAQCCGGEGRKPAVLATDGSHWITHDHTWPTHRSRLLRVVP